MVWKWEKNSAAEHAFLKGQLSRELSSIKLWFHITVEQDVV
jgi:hypothetical protein